MDELAIIMKISDIIGQFYYLDQMSRVPVLSFSPADVEHRNRKDGIPTFTWKDGIHVYTACIAVRFYAAGFRWRARFTRDGKEVTIKAVSRSCNRLTVAYDEAHWKE